MHIHMYVYVYLYVYIRTSTSDHVQAQHTVLSDICIMYIHTYVHVMYAVFCN